MKTASDLDKLYTEAEQVDKRDFAKMKSSLKLIAGEHYQKEGSSFQAIRTSREIPSEMKLRLTKNHTGRIVRRTANNILSSAPGVHVKPKHDRELQDIKAADLNQAIWQDIKEANDYAALCDEWGDDFTGIGEVWTKVYFDPTVRKIKYADVYGFNILRAPQTKDVRKSPWLCFRQMVDAKELRVAFPQHSERIQETSDETFLVFQDGDYRMSKKTETLLREWYFRPCIEYPTGYFILQVKGIILDQGELPGGIFPLVGQRYEYVQTKPRGIAATEPLRPYQLEVNRTASKIAEHQITLGDDKIIMQNGSKMSAGATLPGVRGITVTGSQPIIMEGRSGAQYAEYMNSQIEEMYRVADMEETEEMQSNLDPHTLLYRAASQKRKFSRYVRRFESFLKKVAETSLQMARLYYNEQDTVMAVGKNEQVNIAEFKSSLPQSVQIVLEPQTEDVESKLGRQLAMTNILQYVGSHLDPASIGKILKQTPYANLEESFADLTLNTEVADNLILALDRGEMGMIFQYEDHNYLISRLSKRMTESDFKYMHPFIQQNYQKQIDQRMQIVEMQKQALQRAQSGFIPEGGALIGVDYYVTDPNNPDRTRRARIPYAAVEWLVVKLQEQGSFIGEVSKIPQEVLAQSQMSSTPQAQGANAEIINPMSAGTQSGMM